MSRTLEVVYSPALLPLYNVEGRIVVVIDILRASSSICVAFQTGVRRIIPVSSPEECRLFRDFDFLCAAERNAVRLEGFDLGNSPFEYRNPLLKDRSIAMTTTNGSRAIRQARDMRAARVVVGCFLNLDFLCEWLEAEKQDVLLLCTGWKDKVNMEDTLFAGAVVNKMQDHFSTFCDSGLMAAWLYKSASDKLGEVVRRSSHANRFKALNNEEDDVAFCLQLNTIRLLPELKEEYLVCG